MTDLHDLHVPPEFDGWSDVDDEEFEEPEPPTLTVVSSGVEPSWVPEPPPWDDLGPSAQPVAVAQPKRHKKRHKRAARLEELREERRQERPMPPDRLAELDLLAEEDFGDVGSLAEWKKDPPQKLKARINHLTVMGGNAIVYGVYKVGKSTVEYNLADSLLDGVPFLGMFDVEPLDGSFIILDWEDDPSMQFDRATRRPLRNENRLFLRSYRDTGCTPMDDDCAEQIRDYIARHEGETVLVNTVSSSIAGDPNKFKTADEYLRRWGQIKTEAGAKELILGAHTAHTTTRGEHGIPLSQHVFGSSQFMNWKDAGLSLTMSERTGQRYVDVTTRLMEPKLPRLALSLDFETQAVTAELSTVPAGPGSRGGRTKDEVKPDVIALLKEATQHGEELSGRAIEEQVTGRSAVIREVLDKLVAKGRVSVRRGPNRSRMHSWIG